MTKHFLIPIVLMAFMAICNTACQKENQGLSVVSEPTSDGQATDRTLQPYNPCGNRQTVWGFHLATSGSIALNAFQENWKVRELDRIANDCVLGNSLPGNCSAGGMAIFQGLPAFNLSNFSDANGYVSPQQQDLIIERALAFARSNISTCGEGTSPKIYQIDFMISLQAPIIEFAVRYSCCPSIPPQGE